MRVLVGLERSGIIRDAFIAAGHDAVSCDLSPTDRPGPYYQGDVRDILNDGWDLGIFHPVCTYLSCSGEWAYGDGPYHQKVKPETLVGAARREAREEAIAFVEMLWEAPIKRKCVENPKGVLSTRWMEPTQYIQPYQYGENASKETCLWLDHLDPLVPTGFFIPRLAKSKDGRSYVMRWGNQTDSGQNNLPPSADRARIRGETYPGWADAMADQWGDL